MKIIDANSSTVLALGRCGENLARKVLFDITDFESLYGVGTVEILYQRPNDAQPYPLAVQRDGTSIVWNVTSTDTATPSAFGKCELRYYSGETLVKSKIWQTWVDTALSTPSETVPPEPEQGWVDKVLEAGQAAVNASVNSPKIGENGNWWTWDFEAGAYVDTGVAASGGGSGAVSSVNGKTGVVKLTAEDVGAVPAPATAAVGQTIVVKAVDEAGKPTEWEAADMPSGGGAVDDVQINGDSIVNGGVANIPLGRTAPGVAKFTSNCGFQIISDGSLMPLAWSSYVNNRQNAFMTYTVLDYVIKSAMCDGKGATWTDVERIAALLRMGCTVDDNGFVKWTAQEVAE